MIEQMAKTGSETVEQAPLRLANPARLFSIRNSQSCDLGAKIGKDRAVAPARLERRTGEQLLAIADDERNREGRRTDPARRLALEPFDHRSKIGPHGVKARDIGLGIGDARNRMIVDRSEEHTYELQSLMRT